MKTTRAFPLSFLALGILLSCTLTSCTDHKPKELATAFSLSDTMMRHCEFYTTTAESVKNEIRFFGKISVDKNKMAMVYPIVGGNVLKINVELGDHVKPGQVLATIQSTEVAEFQKEKLDAKNDVAIAEKNYQVAKDLFEGKLASEKDVTAAARELEKARAELERINEIYSIYHLQDGSTYNILAPMSGFIVTKNINQNEQLRAVNSDPLFSIAETNVVWALANVNESDISKVQIGYEADVRTLSFPGDVYIGKVDKIFNAIDPETKAMIVRVKIPNPKFKLKPEMNATVTVKYVENRKMIAVPSTAVIFDKSKYWVMSFKDRYHINTKRIEPYRQLGDITYVQAGLSEGEKVISKNGLFVYDALND
jgi:cobalt-zinc-cadmium efflux system membrane fusion protein